MILSGGVGADALQYHAKPATGLGACSDINSSALSGYFNENQKQGRQKIKLFYSSLINVQNILFDVCLQKQNHKQLFLDRVSQYL